MYTIDDRDTVRPLHDAPRPDAGAPVPMLIADDGQVDLVYVASEPDPRWDGTSARVVGTDTGDLALAVVTFSVPWAHLFGLPNDEAFSGHPLYARGLRPCGVYEVEASSWVRRYDEMNRAHPRYDPARAEAYRHFVFAFHDSTFDCIARDFDVELTRGSVRSVAASVLARR